LADSDFSTIEAKGIRVALDLRAGHVRSLEIEADGRTLRPLHTAPWVDDPSITGDESIPPNLRLLSGDFFCAPFGLSDVEPAPSHGWTANSPWRHVETRPAPGAITALYRLERPVMGAVVEKALTLRDGHPFLYETHTFIGGHGSLPVANHAMTRFPAGGRLSFSPKAFAETPRRAPEPDPGRGRSRLAYPAHEADPTRMPTADGGTADITRYPFAERHEDVVMLVEAPGHALGWIAAARFDSRDLFISLKNPADYPVTILWFSNGGRDYAPWNSRHVGVLGMEEGRIYSTHGHKAAIAANPLNEAGIPTALALSPDGRVEVRNVVGGLPLPAGADAVEQVEPAEGQLILRFAGGGRLAVPYDDRFLMRG
jgi:hypothetical protein